MGNPHLRLAAPTVENRTVIARRVKNAALRSRERSAGKSVAMCHSGILRYFLQPFRLLRVCLGG
jgi:hypothetical protein